jgi:hypothetical protein
MAIPHKSSDVNDERPEIDKRHVQQACDKVSKERIFHGLYRLTVLSRQPTEHRGWLCAPAKAAFEWLEAWRPISQ